MKHNILLIVLFAFFSQLSFAQIANPVKWTFSNKKINADTYEIYFKASIEKGWHLYATDLPPGGPISTSFSFTDTSGFAFVKNT